MKLETVTYELVRGHIDDLVKAGEKITIANVLARSGGSAGKIADFVKRWKNEQRLINAYSISDQMLTAIIAENNIAVKKAVADKEKEIADMQALLTELQEINTVGEAKIVELDEVKSQLGSALEKGSILEQQLKESRDSESHYIAELSVVSQKLNDVTKLYDELNQQLTQAKNEEMQARQELISKSAKIEQLEKHIDTMYSKLQIK